MELPVEHRRAPPGLDPTLRALQALASRPGRRCPQPLQVARQGVGHDRPRREGAPLGLDPPAAAVLEDPRGTMGEAKRTPLLLDRLHEGTGEPDRSAYSENDLQFIDCADHAGGPLEYSLEIEVDTSAEVAFFAFVDPDGDSSTTDYRAGSEANPVTVEEGGTYTDIDFVLTAD